MPQFLGLNNTDLTEIIMTVSVVSHLLKLKWISIASSPVILIHHWIVEPSQLLWSFLPCHCCDLSQCAYLLLSLGHFRSKPSAWKGIDGGTYDSSLLFGGDVRHLLSLDPQFNSVSSRWHRSSVLYYTVNQRGITERHCCVSFWCCERSDISLCARLVAVLWCGIDFGCGWT